MHEKEVWPSALFITLTYSDQFLPENLSVNKAEMQLWLKRLRKTSGKKLRYYVCGEYGELKGRPHYHAIVFGLSSDDIKDIERSWTKGFVTIGTVTSDSCLYVAKYIQKQYASDVNLIGRTRPFALMSKKIGLDWAIKNQDQITSNLEITQQGKKVTLPRYYTQKLGIDAADIKLKKQNDDFDEDIYIIDKIIRKRKDLTDDLLIQEVDKVLKEKDSVRYANTMARRAMKREKL